MWPHPMPLQAPVDILLLFEHQFFDIDTLLVESRNFGLAITDAPVERLNRERAHQLSEIALRIGSA